MQRLPSWFTSQLSVNPLLQGKESTELYFPNASCSGNPVSLDEALSVTFRCHSEPAKNLMFRRTYALDDNEKRPVNRDLTLLSPARP